MKSMKLSTKLFIAFTVMGIVPAVILAGIVFYISSQTQMTMNQNALSAFQGGADDFIRREGQRLQQLGLVLATDSEIAEALRQGDSSALGQTASILRPDDFLVYADATGKVVSGFQGQGGYKGFAPDAVPNPSLPDGIVAAAIPFPDQVSLLGRFAVGQAGSVYVGAQITDNFVD